MFFWKPGKLKLEPIITMKTKISEVAPATREVGERNLRAERLRTEKPEQTIGRQVAKSENNSPAQAPAIREKGKTIPQGAPAKRKVRSI